MKKKIFKRVIILISALFIVTSGVYAEDKLKLESDYIKNNDNNSYMSVLDIYNIKIFNDKVAKRKEEIKLQEEKETEQLYKAIFAEDKDDKLETNKDVSISDAEKYGLFTSAKSYNRVQYKEDTTNNKMIIMLVIIISCAFTGIITRLYYVRKSKGEENNFEYNDYSRL